MFRNQPWDMRHCAYETSCGEGDREVSVLGMETETGAEVNTTIARNRHQGEYKTFYHMEGGKVLSSKVWMMRVEGEIQT